MEKKDDAAARHAAEIELLESRMEEERGKTRMALEEVSQLKETVAARDREVVALKLALEEEKKVRCTTGVVVGGKGIWLLQLWCGDTVVTQINIIHIPPSPPSPLLPTFSSRTPER
jgi:hypothetical protein